jgi:hypothetical protein
MDSTTDTYCGHASEANCLEAKQHANHKYEESPDDNRMLLDIDYVLDCTDE